MVDIGCLALPYLVLPTTPYLRAINIHAPKSHCVPTNPTGDEATNAAGRSQTRDTELSPHMTNSPGSCQVACCEQSLS